MADSSAAASPETKAGLLIRARLVLPMNDRPIPNGAVLVRGNKIAAIGPWRELSSQPRRRTVDLGASILMPGLINAHCHLDYTDMAGQLPPPKRFTDWLKLIVSIKAGWTLSDYRQSWRRGADMLLRTGTTTAGDIEAFPELLPAAWESTPLRLISFLEMIGLSGRREPLAIVNESVKRIRQLRHGRCRGGLSPHAPYSTLPALLRLSARTARRRNWLLCTHVAESAQEFEMFANASGEMFDWLKRSGRDMSDCGSVSPVRHLEICGVLGRNLLAVHANYLRRGDAHLLARKEVNVVHCPRSHFYFRHDKFPLRRLLRAGVNICLGTDSLATVYKRRRSTLELNMFEEMQELASRENWLSPQAILRMATLNGARALDLAGQAGELKENSFADLIAVPFEGKPKQACEAVVQHAGPVAASMIGGRWAIAPTL